MIRVNIGCGRVFDREWVNLDVAPAAPEVRAWDARAGLPFGDRSVDAVYHSHVLEHLEADAGKKFLAECARVLRPGGILRVAVPDLESVARAYLAALDDRRGPDLNYLAWLRLELTDQYARARSGGEVLEFVRGLPSADIDKVRARVGMELDLILDDKTKSRGSLGARLRTAGWRRVFARLRAALARASVRVIGGKPLAASFAEGVFRASGEVHRCAYDRVALNSALTACGLTDVQIMSAGVSRIPGFGSSGLEVVQGRVRKPDSLFVEAVRP